MGEEQHCACFKTLCLHPDFASSQIDKIFVNKHAHRMLSSSILCVMTSTDNITQRACARGLQLSLCLSVSLSVSVSLFDLEAPFSGLKLTSAHSR